MADHLLTILHISDLHIGDIEPTSAELDAEARRPWRTVAPLRGYLGHTEIALRQLHDTWQDLLEADENARVVVTGGVTATGAAGQYVIAKTYLLGALLDLNGKELGLNLGRHGGPGVIPGNHDHWPGHRCLGVRLAVCMQGSETPAFGRFFPQRPLLPVRIPLRNGCTVVIAGLDSDADVPPGGVKRFAARGSFESQCDAVEAQLRARPDDELRVLLVHHSSITAGVPRYKLRIDRRSRRALASLVQDTGIAIVLTGHQHWPDYARPVDDPAVVEARCGTTTCRDFFPGSRTTEGKLYHNGLLVHRLFEDEGGGIVWKTEVRARREWADPFEVSQTVSFGRLWVRSRS